MGLCKRVHFFYKVVLLNFILFGSLLCAETGSSSSGSSQSQLTPEVVNGWAEKILDNVFNARHRDTLATLKDPSTIRILNANRENLINEHRGKPEAAILKASTVDKFISNMETSVKSNKDINTIALMVDGDKIYIAGNIKNVDLPNIKEPFLYRKFAMKKDIIYPHDNFGLQNADSIAIKNAVKELDLKSYFHGKDPQVFIVRPIGQGQIDLDLHTKIEEERKLISEKEIDSQRSQLGRLSDKLKKEGKLSEKQILQRVLAAEERFQKVLISKMADFDKNTLPAIEYGFNVDKAHVYHAEMQLLHRIKEPSDLAGEKVVLGVSKSLCGKCQTGLEETKVGGKSAKEIVEFAQGEKPGLAAEKVKNWDHPSDIQVDNLNDMYERASTSIADLEVELKSVDFFGACSSRTKRSIGGGTCVKINSKAFVEEYASGHDKQKAALAAAAKTNGVELTGTLEDQFKVKKLIQLEDIKSHQRAASGSKLKQKGQRVWDNIELSVGKVKTKLSQTNVARKINTLVSSKQFNGATSTLSKTGTGVGVFMLGKSVINGVIQKDYTTLGIIGGRVGLEAVEKGSQLTANLLNVGSKLGKTAKLISKVAGPIGVVADVGLSIYSLSKAVERFKNARDEYEKKDAVADIVQESIDIGITTAVVVATVAFPPAGIVIAITGIVVSLATQLATAIFKTHNEIESINAVVPLLDFEKREQFSSRFFNWFGTRQDDYVDHLVSTTKLNNQFVQHNMKFLKDNRQFTGIAFPARSISYSGSCRLERKSCYLKNVWGCTNNFENYVTLATGCDHGQTCYGYDCTDYWKSTGDFSYDEYRCLCDGRTNVQEGYPRLDNYVDFRNKRLVYLERVVPQAVQGATFRCRPGHETYQGFRISQRTPTRDEYLCKATIALLQPNMGPESMTFYFDLGEGEDTVLLDDRNVEGNTFLVQDGTKFFSGSNGPDHFIIHPSVTNLSGKLNGGSGPAKNSLILMEGLLENKRILYKYGNLSIENEFHNHLRLELNNINEIIGREMNEEDIYDSCDLTTIRLQGGTSKNNPDVVNVDKECRGTTLVIISEGFTKVVSTSRTRSIQVVGQTGSTLESETNLSAELEITYVIQHSSTVLKNFQFNIIPDSYLIVRWDVVTYPGSFSLKFKLKGDDDKDIVLGKNVKILFHEGNQNSSSYSVMSLASDTPTIIHTLENPSGGNRIGSSAMGNIFLMKEGNWHVSCGNSEHFGDRIVLTSNASKGRISCKQKISSIKHILSFEEGNENDDHLKVDLMNGNFGESGLISGISVVEGREFLPENVKCGCDTESVATHGGSIRKPDILEISNKKSLCKDPYKSSGLTVVVEGHTNVLIDNGLDESTKIILIATSPNERNAKKWLNLRVKITADVNSSTIPLILFLTELSIPSVTFNQVDGADFVTIKIGQNDKMKISSNFEMHSPQISLFNRERTFNGLLTFDFERKEPRVDHFLSHTCIKDDRQYYGISGISENFFRIVGTCHKVRGGEGVKNYFILQISANSMGGTLANLEIEGGVLGGPTKENNMLIVEELFSNNETMTFHLERNWFGRRPSEGGLLKNVQSIIGRKDAPDNIVLSCASNLTSLDGRGGLSNGLEDKIVIVDPTGGNTCLDNQSFLQIPVRKYTKVENTASTGNFIYDVYLESGLDCLKIFPTTHNHHRIKYNFLPNKLVTGASYDKSSNMIQLHFAFNDSLKYPAVKMENAQGHLNPHISFQSPTEDVTCEIELGESDNGLQVRWEINSSEKDDVIHGLDVYLNVFILNISSSVEITKPLSLYGGPGNSTSNDFWLVSAPPKGLRLISGSKNSLGKNSIHFSETFHSNNDLTLDLKEDHSLLIIDGEDSQPIQMDNLHRIYGRPNGNDTVIPACSTEFISGFKRIILRHDYCHWYFLDIIVNGDTSVTLLTQNATTQTDRIKFFIPALSLVEPDGEFHYHFQLPRSFTPSSLSLDKKYNEQLLLSDHIYHLSFKLETLEQIDFYEWNDTLTYVIDGVQYFHEMLVKLDDLDEFYRQPKFVTLDNECELKVGRMGEIVAICHDHDVTDDEEEVEELLEIGKTNSKLAVRLGITIFHKTSGSIMQAGHNRSDERNLFTTSENVTNYFFGGGAPNSIYEIKHLKTDIFIDGGFFAERSEVSSEVTKQIIDLTDVIVPLRYDERNKYVPNVRSEGNDLIIFLREYADRFPGTIRILDGVNQHKLFQLLLNSALMELSGVGNRNRRKRDVAVDSEFLNSDSNKLTTRITTEVSETDEPKMKPDWSITPSPIIVEPGSVFSISQEDLEDDHQVILGGKSTILNSEGMFQLYKSEIDLVISDLSQGTNSNSSKEPTIIIISDFYSEQYKLNSTNETQLEIQALARNIQINLPGISTAFNVSVNSTKNDMLDELMDGNNSPHLIQDWDEALEETEEILLVDMPEVPRTFARPKINYYLFILIASGILLIFLAILGISIRRKDIWSGKLIGGVVLSDIPTEEERNFTELKQIACKNGEGDCY